ncbi:unnamed protein product, partial [Schistosoma turkestanicum]
CIISLCYLFVGNIYSLFTFLGFVQWLAIGLCVFIVIVFRITRPNYPRPVKAPILFPIIYVLVSIFLVIFAFTAAPIESLLGVVILCAGIPLYLIGCVWRKKSKSIERKFESFTIAVQKLFRVVPSS